MVNGTARGQVDRALAREHGLERPAPCDPRSSRPARPPRAASPRGPARSRKVAPSTTATHRGSRSLIARRASPRRPPAPTRRDRARELRDDLTLRPRTPAWLHVGLRSTAPDVPGSGGFRANGAPRSSQRPIIRPVAQRHSSDIEYRAAKSMQLSAAEAFCGISVPVPVVPRRDLERHTVAPTSPQIDGPTTHQVAVVLATEIRLDVAAIVSEYGVIFAGRPAPFSVCPP